MNGHFYGAHRTNLQMAAECLYVKSVGIDTPWNTWRCSSWTWPMPRPALQCVIADLTRETWIFRLLGMRAAAAVCGLSADIYQTFLGCESQAAAEPIWACPCGRGGCCAGRGAWTPITATLGSDSPITDKGFSEMLAAQPERRGQAAVRTAPFPSGAAGDFSFLPFLCAVCSGETGVHSCALAALTSEGLPRTARGRAACRKDPTC